MKVWLVTGYNGILKAAGPVGVGVTEEIAKQIVKEHTYMLDDVLITEMEVQENIKDS